jgi:hypothetical protein
MDRERLEVRVAGVRVGYVFSDRVVREPDRFFPDDRYAALFDGVYAQPDLLIRICERVGGYFVEGHGTVTYDLSDSSPGYLVRLPDGRFANFVGSEVYPEESGWRACRWEELGEARRRAIRVGGTVVSFRYFEQQYKRDHQKGVR